MNGIKKTGKMTSRETILNAIRQNKPEDAVLPAIPVFEQDLNNNLQRFVEVATNIGAVCNTSNSLANVIAFYNEQKNSALTIINGIGEMDTYDIDKYGDHTASQLSSIDYLFLKGEIGVSENGAIWLTDKIMCNRLLPFITKNLVLVIDEKALVPTMHEAYEMIKPGETGYGVFIAGPSKTADIEQALVIGAHGPLSLHIFIISE